MTPQPSKRILIVEDEKTLAHALATKIEHEGFATHIASTGKEGLQEALSGNYDAILLDLMLPEVDGFMILEELQKAKRATPVIVLTNLGQDKDRQRAQTLGATEYFVKADTPISAILRKIKEVM